MKLTPITQVCQVLSFENDVEFEKNNNKNLTTDEIRSLKDEIRILSYDMDKFLEAASQEHNNKYDHNFRNLLSECIHDTIDNLYSIIKYTHQGVTVRGPI